MRRSKAIATAVIIILLVAILGVVIYGSMTMNSGKEIGSGEPNVSGEIPSGGISSGDPTPGDDVTSGNISSGDDVSSGDMTPPVEEPEEKELSATIPFDSKYMGSFSYQLFLCSDEAMEKFEAGEEVSFYLYVDTEEDLTYRNVDPEHYQASEDYLTIVPDEQIKNKYKITYKDYLGSLLFSNGEGEMHVFVGIDGSNISVFN